MFSTIVIGLDQSATAHRAFIEGAELGRLLDAHLHLVTSFVDGPLGGVAISDERRAAEQMLDSSAREADPAGQKVTTHALPGKTADVILRVAEEVGADLIVIGNQGAQGARRVLGSVASAVTGGAPCTVMVVKTT